MIPTVWHFRKSKTIETIKRAAVPKGNGGVMNSSENRGFLWQWNLPPILFYVVIMNT